MRVALITSVLLTLPALALAGEPMAKPNAASQTIERGESCLHLSGEFGGDGSERDKELTQEMTRLKCGTVVKSLKRLKSTLPRDSRQLTEVNELLKAFE
jgi:hypothetical protein